MNILFVDDTEQLNGQYVGIGGVIFHDGYLYNLFSLFNQKKVLHGIPPEEEIKWSPSKNSWISKNLIDDNRISAYSDILALVRSFNGKIIVAVVQRGELKQSLLETKWNVCRQRKWDTLASGVSGHLEAPALLSDSSIIVSSCL